MLFRDFSMIAAISYAAMSAADFEPERMLWDELEESARNGYMQSALAVARGEPTTIGTVFEATAKAIFDYNNGQGLLALEELMNLGSTVMSLELLNEEDVADTNIRESIVGLLQELQERRQGGGLPQGIKQDPEFVEQELRENALAAAITLSDLITGRGKDHPAPITDMAQAFYDFLTKPSRRRWSRSNALHQAVRASNGVCSKASTVVLVAEDFMLFLEPPTPAEPAVAEEPQVETVQ